MDHMPADFFPPAEYPRSWSSLLWSRGVFPTPKQGLLNLKPVPHPGAKFLFFQKSKVPLLPVQKTFPPLRPSGLLKLRPSPFLGFVVQGPFSRVGHHQPFLDFLCQLFMKSPLNLFFPTLVLLKEECPRLLFCCFPHSPQTPLLTSPSPLARPVVSPVLHCVLPLGEMANVIPGRMM